MTVTPTYLQRSLSDFNSFLATKPHLPKTLQSSSQKSALRIPDFTSQLAHGPSTPTDDPTYLDRILDRDDFRRRLDCLFASHNLDVLMLPDVQIPPPRYEDSNNGRFKTMPAIIVPAGFPEDGLRVGMDMVGMEFSEQTLLELAQGRKSS
ncbi:hypothetical protein LTR36_004503 [Oleoguttula mirabilis]|uniref:Amidase domain-containing protein n=1 Tax=Oleoguttula mirabilis TaxID=1507867 RepID=A0AAV9JG46_9PEZI|nr:hypothetical protein LTR36_004503 [Oleoguttula mirabilis]